MSRTPEQEDLGTGLQADPNPVSREQQNRPVADRHRTNPYWRQVSLGGTTGAAEKHARSQQTRQSILKASGELFARHGYTAVSLSMIAAKVGISKGSMTSHFPTKMGLAREVLNEMRTQWLAMCADIDRRGLDPLTALRTEIDEVLAISFADPIVLGGSRLAQDPEVVRNDEETHFVVGEARILQHLSRAELLGQLRPGVKPAAAASLIMAVVTGHGTIQARHPDHTSIGQRIAEAWSLLLPLLAVSSSPAPPVEQP